MTANDLIASSLRLIGVLASGETASGAEASDALVVLNDMLDQWNAERLTIFDIIPQDFPLVAEQQLYTLGTGGNFNIARPPRIERASLMWLANPSQPLELPLDIMDYASWQAIPVKDTTSTQPRVVYVEYSFPLINLRYYPVPNIISDTRLYVWNPLTSFTALSTDLTFPPGYAKALRYNLALDLAPEYGRPVPPEVAVQAVDSKGKIKSINAPAPIMSVDAALRGDVGLYNWLNDDPAGRR